MSLRTQTAKPTQYAGRGRPCSLTPELQETVCAVIAKGNYLTTACAAVGISQKTLRTWVVKGEEEEQAGNITGIFSLFLSAVKKAEAQSELALVDAVQAHNKSNVVAPLAMLDRRFPERWAQTRPANTGGGNTYNINIDKAVVDAAGKFDAIMKAQGERAENVVELASNDVKELTGGNEDDD